MTDLFIIFFTKYLGWILGLAVVFIFFKNWRLLFESFLSALVARFGFTELIRYFYNRPRPFEIENITPLISHESGGSFPSGHAAFFFALATSVFFYRRVWGVIFFLAAFSIGFSRVATGIHWPSDILGGAVIGVLTSLLVHFLAQKFKRPGPDN